MSALHWAASLNLVDIVKLLFEYDANANILDLKIDNCDICFINSHLSAHDYNNKKRIIVCFNYLIKIKKIFYLYKF